MTTNYSTQKREPYIYQNCKLIVCNNGTLLNNTICCSPSSLSLCPQKVRRTKTLRFEASSVTVTSAQSALHESTPQQAVKV